jgi:hypothetical protein
VEHETGVLAERIDGPDRLMLRQWQVSERSRMDQATWESRQRNRRTDDKSAD